MEQHQAKQGICSFCSKEQQDLKTCSACKKVFYCTVECQKKHWKSHKSECTFKSTKKPVQKQQQQIDPNQNFFQFNKQFEAQQATNKNNYIAEDERILKEITEKYQKIYEQRFEEKQKSKQIEPKYEEIKNEKVLTLESLAQIQSSYGELCGEELLEVEVENRKQRREILQKSKNEESEIGKYTEKAILLFRQKDQFLKVAQKVILKAIDVDVSMIEITLKVQSSEGKAKEIQQIMGKVQQEQKAVLKSKNPVKDVEKISEIFKFQKDLVASEKDFVFKCLQNFRLPLQIMQDIVPIVISMILLDNTFEKFGIEEEDLFEFLNDNKNWTKDLEQLEKDINEGTYKIISEFVQNSLNRMRNK